MMSAWSHRCGLPLLIALATIISTVTHAEALQDITFTAHNDSTEQKYILILPEAFDPKEEHALMIALHGHGSDRWQFGTSDIAEARAARDVAQQHNMFYVSPDYRAKTSWMGPKAEEDLLQIIEELKKTYRINSVIVVGASMGGTSSLTFVAIHPDKVQGVVSLNGTANHFTYEKFQDAIQASFGGTKQDIPVEYKKRSAEYWPEQFTMPIAFTTGGKDTVVPPDSVNRLAKVVARLNDRTLLIYRPEGGHSTTYEDAIAAYDFVCKQVLQQPINPKEPK